MRIRFEPKGNAPLYKELADTLYNAIVSGEIAHGEKLPTVRQLAEEAGVTLPDDRLEQLAERFALERGGRSARLARQLVDRLRSEGEDHVF